jgi:hypothetical protein
MVHESYKNYKRAKRDFRNELNAEHERYMASVFQDIDEASECDIRLFWKLVKQQRPKNTRLYTEVELDGKLMDDPVDIANGFASHFERIYNPIDNDNFDSDFFNNIENAYSSIKKSTSTQHDSMIPGGEILSSEVSCIIKDLKRRKAPGIDCIQNEHLIYGGSSLSKCISHLFNSIIHIGKIPTAWKKDIIVPIHKGNNKPKKSPDS